MAGPLRPGTDCRPVMPVPLQVVTRATKENRYHTTLGRIGSTPYDSPGLAADDRNSYTGTWKITPDISPRISLLAHRSESQVRKKGEEGVRDERGRKWEATVERGRKKGSDSRKREETSTSPANRKPPGGIGKCHQHEVPNQRARRNVRRWKGQPASLCPVLKTCPTSWLHYRRILDFC